MFKASAAAVRDVVKVLKKKYADGATGQVLGA